MVKKAFIVDPLRNSWWFTQALLSGNKAKVLKCFEGIPPAQTWLADRRTNRGKLDMCILNGELVLTQNPGVLVFLFQLRTLGIEAIALTESLSPNLQKLHQIQEKGHISRVMIR